MSAVGYLSYLFDKETEVRVILNDLGNVFPLQISIGNTRKGSET